LCDHVPSLIRTPSLYGRRQGETVGKGAGSKLYAELFRALEAEDLHRAYAGIALPNPASIALHERFGFKRVAHFTEQGRKFGRYWDVDWYEKPLGEAT